MATTRDLIETAGGLTVQYPALGNENGAAFYGAKWPDKTIQATGSGTVTLEGSSDGTNWAPLNDTAGAAISLDATAEESAVVLENTPYMRAVNTAASANVVIVCR